MPAAPRLSTWARALASAAALALLVIGAPWLLLRAGTLPSRIPSAADIGDTLTAADDGHVLFTVLTLAAWALWAWFLLSLLIEAASLLRRVRTPRIRGFGSAQRLAGVLLGGLLMLPSATALAATPALATTAVATTHIPHAPATPDVPQQTQAPEHATGPVHVVGATGETVWDLAEQYLGGGQRHTEIKALNPGLADQSFLTEGTTVRLPADAHIPVPATTDATSHASTDSSNTAQPQGSTRKEATASYTVRAGDNLSSIADSELGDGDRWPEIYEANEGGPQPYGHTFTDPDRIYPGQELTLPTESQQPGHGTEADQPASPHDTRRAAPDNDRPAAPERDEHQEAQDKQDDASPAPDAQQQDREEQAELGAGAAGARSTAPEPAGSPAAHTRASTSAEPETGATSSASAPAEPTAPAASGGPTASAASAGEREAASSGSRAGVIGLAATGILAAGLVGSLAYRRTMQQRRRRRGHRIAMPSGRSAETERAMRSVDAGVELGLLAGALRTAALHLAQEGRPLPEITTVQLGARGVRLHLAEAVPTVAPFTAVPGQSGQWWCPAGTRELLPAEELREVDPPFPALAVLGEDEDGAIVLVDLEHVGALHLTGTGRLALLRTLALSLALTPLAEQIEIAVAGEDTAPGLSMLDGNRVTPYPDLGDAVRGLEQHQTGQQQVLEEFGAEGSLSVARASEDLVEELWPLVVLADLDTCPDVERSQGRLWQVLEAPVRSAMVIVTSSTVAPDRVGVWCVDTDAGEVIVPGSGVRVQLVTVTEEEYVDVLELGLTADSPTDHPGPPPAAPEPQPAAPAVSYYEEELETQPAVPSVPYYSEEPASAEAGTDPAGVSGLVEKDVRGPGLLAGLAGLDDEPGERPVDEGRSVHQGLATREPSGQSVAAAASPGNVLPALVFGAKSSVGLPQPVDAGESVAVEEGDATPAQATVDDACVDAEGDASPLVCVLGPVELKGARGSVASNRRTLALELTTWLAFHPGANSHQLDEVIAPSGRVTRDTRNSRIGDVRKWLGTNPADTFYLPHMNQQPDKLYRLEGVRCDWTEFERLVEESHRADGADAQQLLRQALTLVRGRPFAGIPARRYTWAEPLCQDMVSAIVDAADDLADRCLKLSDARGALWAVARGLDVAREMECLWRHKFRALDMLGQYDELDSEVRALDALVLDLGTAVEEATEDLLRQLESSRH